MKPTRLLLAGTLMMLPCACKKSESGEAADTGIHASTKVSERPRERHSHESPESAGDSGPAEITDDTPPARLIETAVEAEKTLKETASKLTGVDVEEHLATTMNDPAMLDSILKKKAEAETTKAEAEKLQRQALEALRGRHADDPVTTAYLAYMDQADRLTEKRKEIMGSPEAAPDPEAIAELQAEAAKLRELKTAWEAVKPQEE